MRQGNTRTNTIYLVLEKQRLWLVLRKFKGKYGGKKVERKCEMKEK